MARRRPRSSCTATRRRGSPSTPSRDGVAARSRAPAGASAKARERLGFVPNVFRTSAFRPERLSAWFEHVRACTSRPTTSTPPTARWSPWWSARPTAACTASSPTALHAARRDGATRSWRAHRLRRSAGEPRRAPLGDLRLRREGHAAPAGARRGRPREPRRGRTDPRGGVDVAEIAAMYDCTNRMAMATNMRPNERVLGRRAAVSYARVAPARRDRLVGEAGGDGVDRVVEERRWRPPRLPQKMNGGAMSRAGSVTAALPQIAAPWAAVARARRQAGGAEQPAHDAPAGAVAPVREVVEARPGDVVLELGDAERLGRRPRGRRARRAVAQARLEGARDRHRGGAEEAGDEPVADRAWRAWSGSS